MESKKAIPFKAQRTEKMCTRCEVVKPLSSFGTRLIKCSGNTIHKSLCRDCERISANEFYHRHPRSDKTHNSMIKYKYGLTRESFDELKKKSGGMCGLCGLPMRIYNVDHDHKTGKVRGFLCSKCNTGLGLLNDDIKLLQRAIEYIKASGNLVGVS